MDPPPPDGLPLVSVPGLVPRSPRSLTEQVLNRIGHLSPAPSVYLTAAEARTIADLLDDLIVEPPTPADRRLRQRARLASNLLWERGASGPPA